jgi:hypothetical protein
MAKKVNSNTLFDFKMPRIKNVSWEEINSSWKGLFGHSSKLRDDVIRSEVEVALKDLNEM